MFSSGQGERMTDDERYGQIYGSAMWRVMEAVRQWRRRSRRRVPEGLDEALSYGERVARCAEPNSVFCAEALRVSDLDPRRGHAWARELLEAGHAELALRVATAVEVIHAEERGLHTSCIRAKTGHEAEGLGELVRIAGDATRTQWARSLALHHLLDLEAKVAVLEAARSMLATARLEQAGLVHEVAQALAEAFCEPEWWPEPEPLPVLRGAFGARPLRH